MKAVVHHAYGGVEVLQVADVATPTPREGEVRIAVHAGGLDRGTWHIMTGRPLLARLAFGVRRPKQPVLGLDCAGVVDAVGPGVTDFAVGDRVAGVASGSFATHAIARASKLAPVPDTVDLVDAAVVPISGLTALQALDAARVASGDRVLVLGASGGVGSFAVQLAAARGAEVTGTCSAHKMAFVRSLGAAHAIDYERTDFAQLEQQFDAIIDCGGNPSIARLRRALAPSGTCVIVGSETNGALLDGIGRSIWAAITSPLRRGRWVMLVSAERGDHVARLLELVESGAVTPAVDRRFPLEEAPDAMRHLLAGQVCGKVAIVVNGDPTR